MFNGKLVIDVHGHVSTPPQVRAYAYNLVALRNPSGDDLHLTDEEMEPAIARHLRLLDEKGIDVQLLSPRPVAMMHWERPFLVSRWTRTTNDLIARQCALWPKRFAGVAQLPQSAEHDTSNCVAELERCVRDHGFVGAILNPDPAGDRKAPGLHESYWYPLYEAAEALQTTLLVHPSITFDRRLEIVPHSYQYNSLTEETLATLLLETSDVFARYPKLRIVVCHCGGAPRRLLQGGRPIDAVEQERGNDTVIRSSGEFGGGQVGLNVGRKEKKRLDVSANLFVDTCAYDPHFLSAAVHQWGPSRMVFGTEVPGSGTALLNPQTGKPGDDVLATLSSFPFLSSGEIERMVHDNPIAVFPLLERGPALSAVPAS